jgi:hypothetical protein
LIQRRWEAIDRVSGNSITNANLEIAHSSLTGARTSWFRN